MLNFRKGSANPGRSSCVHSQVSGKKDLVEAGSSRLSSGGAAAGDIGATVGTGRPKPLTLSNTSIPPSRKPPDPGWGGPSQGNTASKQPLHSKRLASHYFQGPGDITNDLYNFAGKPTRCLFMFRPLKCHPCGYKKHCISRSKFV